MKLVSNLRGIAIVGKFIERGFRLVVARVGGCGGESNGEKPLNR